jgi:O-antigen/teichoic acid export membrane protein
LKSTDNPTSNAMAISAVIIFPVAAIVIWFGKERAAVVFGSDDKSSLNPQYDKTVA